MYYQNTYLEGVIIMAIKIYQESSLGTSEIFKEINSIDGGENTQTKAMNLIKTAKHLTVNDIEAAYISVKQVTDSLTRSAIKAFDNDKTVLIYNEDPSKSVSKTLPFITFKMKSGSYITYVFMRQYISINRNGIMTLQPAILRDLLIAAAISTGIRTEYTRLSNNVYLRDILAELYTQFMTRIINRQYSVQSNRIAFESLRYWIKKFFMLRIFGTNDTPENIENSITKDFKYLEKLQLDEISRIYEDINPTVISELVDVLKNASPRMANMSLARFYSDWVNYYGVPSMLALDNIEYLIFMITSLQSGNNIISIAASDIVKECKGIKGFREELLKLI